ncbi:MAG TPA: hypothetical protein VHV10_08040 [Ktedonobacteraceae bacterium]|jgi:hypothetical protein|nr:hypothetical protein [Ktedonobacteraceae bacterium]
MSTKKLNFACSSINPHFLNTRKLFQFALDEEHATGAVYSLDLEQDCFERLRGVGLIGLLS